VNLEDFSADSFVQGGYSIFVVATYGEGDPTDNAVEFMKWLKKDTLEPNCLNRVSFTVFGLGNMQYEHYNRTSKIINARLHELGAQRVYKFGEGNDDGTLEDDFEAWKENLWSSLRQVIGPDEKLNPESSSPCASSMSCEDLESSFQFQAVEIPAPEKPVHPDSEFAQHAEISSKHFFVSESASVSVNRELRQRPSFESSTRHIEIDVSSTNVTYSTADNVYILPENDVEMVNILSKAQGWDLSKFYSLKQSKVHILPSVFSMESLLKIFTDLTSIPKRDFLESIAPFATKQAEKDKLLHLCSKNGKVDYESTIVDTQKSIFEVLTMDFPSVKLSVNGVINLFHRLQPRAYTIASSSTRYPKSIHICVSVINKQKGGNDPSRRLKGVCSNYLYNLHLSKPIRLYVRPSTFRLPQDPTTPVILIGPGTGIAPMIAFLQEKQVEKSKGAKIGPVVLFNGCRSRDDDFIYRDEIQEYVKDNVISSLFTAFSREGPKKVYVQHLIEEQGEFLFKLLESNAHVYVCGATNMGRDVHSAFVHLIMKHRQVKEKEATEVVEKMYATSRYVAELWSS
jgi:NADPH-ferrihemoprotein reductase